MGVDVALQISVHLDGEFVPLQLKLNRILELEIVMNSDTLELKVSLQVQLLELGIPGAMEEVQTTCLDAVLKEIDCMELVECWLAF
jgi:hypothetical protein